MFDLKATVEIVSLSILFSLEHFFPFFKNPSGRLIHAAKNLGMGLINFLVTAVFFSGLTFLVADWTDRTGFGVLNALNWTGFFLWGSAIVLLDFWMYAWHWANHNVAWLWRFHRMHHTDTALDSTSALRFHSGEIVFSSIARLAVIPLLGLKLEHVLIYETLIQPVILFHHSNVAFPERWDRRLRALIVTPNMHRLHHSDAMAETNSNYSTLFSFWDRAARTFRLRDLKTIRYGVNGFNEASWLGFWGMLRTPFASPVQ